MDLQALLSDKDKLKAEIRRLKRAETLFDAMQEYAQFGYCEWDYKNGRIARCTPAFARIFGMNVEEVLESQKDWDNTLDVVHPDDRDFYVKSYEESSDRGAHEVEYRVLRRDGTVRHVWEMLVLVESEDGEGSDSVALLQDITERREREQELEKHEALIQQVESVANIGHFIWDQDEETYKYISPGFSRIQGQPIEEILQGIKSWEDDLIDIHEEDRDRVRNVYQQSYAGQEDYVIEYRICRADGEVRWVQERSTVIVDQTSSNHHAVGVLQDITEKKQIELDLLEQKNTLENEVEARTHELAQMVERLQREMRVQESLARELEMRNAELERFTYTVSHDLKTPLVTIKGFLGLLNRDLEAQDFDRVADDIRRVNGAADTMGLLLNDLLELSRIGRIMNEPVRCNLGELANRAATLVTTQIEDAGAELRIDDLPDVEGDEVRLLEVFQNLIENALKFMGDQPAPRIHVGASVEGDHVSCFVSDNGIGIDEAYHEQIFTLFERLHADVKGTGIGLALVKRIIEAHDGEIHVESGGEGSGSRFVFTLPVNAVWKSDQAQAANTP